MRVKSVALVVAGVAYHPSIPRNLGYDAGRHDRWFDMITAHHRRAGRSSDFGTESTVDEDLRNLERGELRDELLVRSAHGKQGGVMDVESIYLYRPRPPDAPGAPFFLEAIEGAFPGSEGERLGVAQQRTVHEWGQNNGGRRHWSRQRPAAHFVDAANRGCETIGLVHACELY